MTPKPPGPRPRPRKPGVLDRIKSAVALAGRALEFGFYHVILPAVDRVSRPPRGAMMPEAARLYLENIALEPEGQHPPPLVPAPPG